jgi:Flp pilus assembly protein TadG
MHTLATLRTRARRDGGQAVIELALTLPLLLLVLMGIFDFGFQFQRYEVVTNAAREGARIGVLPEYGPADAEKRALDYLLAGGISGAGSTTCPPSSAIRKCVDAVVENVTITGTSPAKTVQQIRVTVMYDYEYTFVGPIMSLFGGSSLGTVRMQAVSTMRLEGF